MRKILGLDLGTASIGWALVNEAVENMEQSEIVKLGVRVNPLTTDEQIDFEKGRPLSINADRTSKRGARRNLQRYKLRRVNLIEILKNIGFIGKTTILTEVGANSTHETYRLRAKAAVEKIDKDEFARVLLTINKKRGYKSSRKAKNTEEGFLIDGMAIAKELYDNGLTPGQFVLNLLNEGKKYIPDFYRSDLQTEFDAIWNFQKQFYPEILNEELYGKLQGQGQQNSRKLFLAIHKVFTAENKGKREEVKMQHYQWRNDALSLQLPIDVVAYVLVEINNNLNKSSGYLGAISDRSKELYFKHETVGQSLYRQLQQNFHTSLKNQVFYRQDYLDEFECIWQIQSKYHPELTPQLKAEIRDVIIFYQRKLKSQKHLISGCEFEKYHKAIPKSSPLFQEFKIWQILNNVQLQNQRSKEVKVLNEELKQILFEELNLRGNLINDEVLSILGLSKKEWKLNYKEGIEGNRTNQALYNVYQQIADFEGYGFDWVKKSATEIKEELKQVFPQIGIKPELLEFNSDIDGNDFDKQSSYQFWHLLYSAEDDNKVSTEDQMIYGNSNVSLKKKLHENFGFKPEYANMLANVSFQSDHGSLSARAIKKILPFLKAGHEYSEACSLAGYNHSHSLTKGELENRPLKDQLELLKKNSLRNPVVEKILNQMVNLVNQVIEKYGKPDEVRIELARDLKQSAKERAEMTNQINSAKGKHEEIRKILQKMPFGIPNPTRNDIIRYKLYEELSENGYKTLFTNQYISPDKLFSKEIDIEHIIPKAVLFDDSFSNKTLAFRSVNLAKADSTAIDFISNKYADDLENYKARVECLYKANKISKAKYKKLLMEEKNLPDGFIERDLRNSQYIAKKAKQMLQDVVRTVNTTTGKITDKLREDWDLMNVMQELNFPKYKALGMIEKVEQKDGTYKERIIDWTKRNDHRHHAMDALTVAFTTYNHVQYLNNLNASRKEESELYGIRNKITFLMETNNGRKKRLFVPPLPNFRSEAKTHLESILVSFKAKNKVVTKNKNRIKLKGKDIFVERVQLTPRGQLHKETVYGKIQEQTVNEIKVNAKLDIETIGKVTNPKYREALLVRLAEFGNDPQKAFAGKNAPTKNPIYLNGAQTEVLPEKVKVLQFVDNYTIRKEINPDLKIEKVIDQGIKRILEARLLQYNGNTKEAFSNLDKNPIWLNQEKGIAIKKVSISGVSNAEALHDMKDHTGNLILNGEGKTQSVDFVSTGNNHHVAIYKDEQGKLQEQVVSFYEAVARVNAGLPIVDTQFNQEEGWQFLFTMKQNEYFIFPTNNFDPKEIDLLDPKNTSLISPNLFRVQKISSKNYLFTNHLETKAIDGNILKTKKQLSKITYYFIQSTEPLRDILKVRINHVGEIVHVGEELSIPMEQVLENVLFN